MTIYKWKSGARPGCKAQVAGEVCAKLERRGNLTPTALVDASRAEDAPLHGAFEWDDAVAAECYRVEQAKYIIRSIEVHVEQVDEPVRAFFPIVHEDASSYRSVGAILRSEGDREQMLSRALSELRAFERKYSTLEELAGVFAAIKEVA